MLRALSSTDEPDLTDEKEPEGRKERVPRRRQGVLDGPGQGLNGQRREEPFELAVSAGRAALPSAPQTLPSPSAERRHGFLVTLATQLTAAAATASPGTPRSPLGLFFFMSPIACRRSVWPACLLSPPSPWKARAVSEGGAFRLLLALPYQLCRAWRSRPINPS